MNHLRAPVAPRSSEAGFALMEVVVAAAVLAVVSFAVLAGINGASGSTGREKARSIAASLAEQDQERMRSMQLDTLAGHTEKRTIEMDGAKFEINSEGKWITDSTGGTPSCQNNSKQAAYVQISSRVTSAQVGAETKPVLVDSLVAPSVLYSSTRGTLGVQVKNRSGVGVPGIMVSISGPAAGSELTNAEGCAIFDLLPEGNYVIQLNRLGWVEHYGVQAAIGNQDVRPGIVNIRTMDYDRAATVVATVSTLRPMTSTAIPLSKAYRVSATNGGEPGMVRRFPDAAPLLPTPTVTLDSLFPFLSAYNVYTGACDEANPVVHDPAYFTKYPLFGTIPTTAGGAHTVNVRQPPLNIQVRSPASGSPLTNGIQLRATQKSSECAVADRNFTLITVSNGTVGWVSQPQAIVAGVPIAGTYDPGLPFGDYDLCLWDPTSRKRRTVTDYDNTNPLGKSTTTTITGGSSSWSSSSYSSLNQACPLA